MGWMLAASLLCFLDGEVDQDGSEQELSKAVESSRERPNETRSDREQRAARHTEPNMVVHQIGTSRRAGATGTGRPTDSSGPGTGVGGPSEMERDPPSPASSHLCSLARTLSRVTLKKWRRESCSRSASCASTCMSLWTLLSTFDLISLPFPLAFLLHSSNVMR